ncbi:MAG: ABC transporter permease [Evtepia sp.]|uniref:ABC transporter permease n=1 Tax=Evtepia sp. TaxID=2773933 RepID=UPI002A75D176|nr:ABC transporter permease [Evtepia sp.]MDY3014793.1 ABC transporter permease [Evtepia sp.]
MGNYTVKRLLGAIPVFFGITLLVFFMMNMAPATIADAAGAGEASSAAMRAALEADLGLDKPIVVRYVLWLKEVLTGDLGLSYRTGQPVLDMIAQRVAPSLLLTGTGVGLAVLLGVPLGVMAAWKPKTVWGRLAGGLTLFSFSAPGFFLCLVGIFVFSVVLGWLPAAGMYTAGHSGSGGDLLRHLILPASVVCLGSLGNLIRQTTFACREVLSEDYIRTARAKGLSEGAVVWKHGFRTALIPVLTTILNHIPHVIGGSMVVERIFGWPGMGSLFFTSVNSRDYPVIMGLTVVIALAVLLTGILMDLVYRLADPGMGWGGARP